MAERTTKKKTRRLASKDSSLSPLGNSKCMRYPFSFMQSIEETEETKTTWDELKAAE